MFIQVSAFSFVVRNISQLFHIKLLTFRKVSDLLTNTFSTFATSYCLPNFLMITFLTSTSYFSKLTIANTSSSVSMISKYFSLVCFHKHMILEPVPFQKKKSHSSHVICCSISESSTVSFSTSNTIGLFNWVDISFSSWCLLSCLLEDLLWILQ